eukprot:scaffold1314_cov386-Pavlova_lutheri.AAC.23
MLVAADSLARGTPKDMLVQSPTPSIVLPAQLLYKVVSTWAVGPDEQSPDVLEPTTSVSGFLNEQQPSTVGSTCRPTVYPRRFCNDIFRVRSTATCRDWRNTACNPPRTGRRLLSNLSYAENVLKSGPDHPEDTEEAKEAKTDVVDAFEENLFSASAIDH